MIKHFLTVAAVGFSVLSSLTAAEGEISSTYEKELDIPPRLQWNANFGYCGEVSFISAGLYFGQYCSQYTAREAASPGVRQSRANSQLLLGVNELKAATAMKLTAVRWKAPARGTVKDFLVWAKSNVLANHPVIIGVFTNEYLFYGTTNRNAGDSDYDHIVPVTGVGSESPLSPDPKTYMASDVITFSDNGLWAPSNNPPYTFSYRFSDFPKTRQEANAQTGPIYSLKSNGTVYGVTITGVADPTGQTVPVRLSTSANYEQPKMQNGSNTPPSPMALTLTVTVTIPDQSVGYNLYRYDSFAKVPTSKFNANASKAAQTWSIAANTGATFTVQVPIQSSQTAVFRAVRTSAP